MNAVSAPGIDGTIWLSAQRQMLAGSDIQSGNPSFALELPERYKAMIFRRGIESSTK